MNFYRYCAEFYEDETKTNTKEKGIVVAGGWCDAIEEITNFYGNTIGEVTLTLMMEGTNILTEDEISFPPES